MRLAPELLAPVGSWEALVAAVQNGADAVYVGGKMFNARQYANNFGEEEMAKAVDYAHIRGTRVYVTVNTLVADQELPELLTYLKFLYETGVDAIIVQDLGVARLVNKVFPELEIHASTQMTLHNSAGVETVKELGIKRIVLAREMSLEEIKKIKQDTGLEIEAFVHGALCISYSGQCLMSSMIGGRSGNRGKCAQPCRLPYILVDEKGKTIADPSNVGKYLLSPRDLRLIHYIPELSKAGVDSLKLEGRMKRPEYVATVTRIYREALDRFMENPERFEVSAEEESQLAQIFNRDFTAGYLTGQIGAELMSSKRPNNRGIKIGRVAEYNPKKGILTIQLEEKLHTGDGIEIWVTEGGRKGIVVSQIFHNGKPVESAVEGQTISIPIKGKIRSGDRVFKTNDSELMRLAGLSFTSPKELRKENIDVEVRAKLGEPLQITLQDKRGNNVIASTEFIAEKAIKRPLTEETIKKQLERLGNTPFQIGKLDIQIDEEIMVPMSEINEARRKAVELLEEKRSLRPKPLGASLVRDRWHKFQRGIDSPQNISDKLMLSAAVGEKDAAKEALQQGADIVYIGADGLRPNTIEVDELGELFDLAEKNNAQLFFSTPRITKDKEVDYLIPYMEKAVALGIGVMVTNLGTLQLALEMGIQKIYADYTLNIFNSQSLLWLQEKGISGVALSTELTLQQIKTINKPMPVEVVVHGSLPLIISEHCVIGSTQGGLTGNKVCHKPCRQKQFYLKDRMGMKFPLITDTFCRTNLFNPKELNLIEDIKPLYEAGVRVLRMEIRKDSVDYVRKVTKIYRQEIDKFSKNIETYVPTPGIKEALTDLSREGVTKGHLYRGVL